MEAFGPFEVTREIDAANGATVYKAQREGDRKGEFIVKVFSLERLVSEEGGAAKSDLDPLFEDIGSSFTGRVNLQKRAAEQSENFVPILAAGHDQRGAWYATNFYARSVKGMLDRFVALESRDLLHLVQSVVRAALHLKKSCGRPHGNLKPSNIFIDGGGKPRSSRVVLSDPLAGDEKDAAAYELADLRAVGELIYQLVLRRKVDFSTGWVILPVETSREWTELFGKQSSDWLNLCNKLLDTRLSLDLYSLEQLQAHLLRLKPRRPIGVTVAPLAAGALLAAGVVVYFVWHARSYGTLLITTDPPGANVTITPLNDYGAEETERAETKTTPATPAESPRPLKLSFKGGPYRVAAEYTAYNGTLKSRGVKVTLEPGRVTATNLYLPHGALVILSEPSGAAVSFGAEIRHTPCTNLFVKPGEVSVELKLANYLPRASSRAVPTNGVAVILESLERIQAGRINVTFSSDPAGGTVQLDDGPAHPAPWVTGLEDGREYTVRTELKGWEPETRRVRYSLSDGVNRTNLFAFQYGILRIGETEPSGAEILLDGKPAGNAPLDLPVPLVEHTLTFRSEGFSNYTAAVSLPGYKQILPVTGVKLQPVEGMVRFIVDPPIAGIQIMDHKTGKLLAVTAAEDLQPLRSLPPTNYDLVATHPYFGTAQAKAASVAGTINQALFKFPYGTVTFAGVEPEDARAAAEIEGPGQMAVRLDQAMYQRPGDSVVYRVKAPAYQDRYYTNSLAAGQASRIVAELSKALVSVRMESVPAGVDFYANGTKLEGAGPEYALAWGPTELVALQRRLGSLTNRVEIKWNKSNRIPTFKFEYGILMLTNLPDDVVVKEGGDELTVQPGPLRLAYERPGSHTYDLYEGGLKVDTITTNLSRGSTMALQSDIATREFRNSIGLALVKVQNLFGPGREGWVGKSEVTESEFERVMGQAANPSAYKGGDLPVENVTWLQAVDFCAKLTQLDTRHPPGPAGQYQLPDLDQWRVFSAGADLKRSVTRGTQPARVGSMGVDSFGLNDVFGNVREWLLSDDPKNKYYIGGGFRPVFGGRSAYVTPQQLQLDQGSDDLGFRVIWVPAR